MMVTAAIVYDWCHAVVSDEQKRVFNDELVRLAKDLECGYPPDKGSFVVGHPSEWMILRDLLSAGVATYDENPEMYRLAAGRIFRSHVPARNWWYPEHALSPGSRLRGCPLCLGYVCSLGFLATHGRTPTVFPIRAAIRSLRMDLSPPARRPVYPLGRRAEGWPTTGMGTLLPRELLPRRLSSWRIISRSPRSITALENSRLANDYRMDDLFEFLWRDPDLKPAPLADLPLSPLFPDFPMAGWSRTDSAGAKDTRDRCPDAESEYL